MYMSRMLEIGKCENGYVISCSVPLKKDAKKSDKMDQCCVDPESLCEKKYIAKSSKEISELVGELIPLLDADYTTENEFNKAFAKATSAESESD